MQLAEILKINSVDDATEIIIRNRNARVVARGKRYQGAIVDYACARVKSLTWEDGNKLFIDLK